MSNPVHTKRIYAIHGATNFTQTELTYDVMLMIT